ncbi:lysine exporter LysO family protein [Cardiobacteriaceae bacterium TAE3-ERU3]|nr:lysine exporter LysO family protein [Cardiobacteriaceae bacterium TAE3-ERU3]
MSTLFTLMPIVVAILCGFMIARFIPDNWQQWMVSIIGPLVWVLLFLIGADFGDLLVSAEALGKALHTALYFTIFSTLIPAAIIAWIYDHHMVSKRNIKPRQDVSPTSLWKPLRSCLVALSMVALGAAMHLLTTYTLHIHLPLPSVNSILIVMVFLAGIDLYRLELKRTHFAPRIFILPFMIIALGLAGSQIAAYITGMEWHNAMALVSGFGWFTLSSVMVGDALGAYYGTTALLIDLTRELLGIIVLYLIGIRYGYMAMSISGAGTMDTVLPIIKTNCGTDKVPQALVSGITLSLLAPLLIGLFLI